MSFPFATGAGRNRRGGTYVEDHKSFGQMMVSGQLRPALVGVSLLVKQKARLNTYASNTGGDAKAEVSAQGKSLADAYELQRGPIIPIRDGRTGSVNPRISHRIVNKKRYAAVREFGAGGHTKGKGTRDLRRAGELFGDLAGEVG